MLELGPGALRRLLNLYPPYVGAGIRVVHIASDWRRVDVEMSLRWFNRNAVGTHFGGNLYSMVDPHLMLMLIRCLGKGYVVWDKWASIEFEKPGRGTVSARLEITQAMLDDVHAHTSGGRKYLPEIDVAITDESGARVALVKKRLYVRHKR